MIIYANCIKLYLRHYRVPCDLATFQILGQKFVKFFVGMYFGPNDDTKRTFEISI